MFEKKREFTTKQVIVPSKYFLECVAKDPDTCYPVDISILGRFACTHRFNTAKELLDASRGKMFFENSVVRAPKRNGHYSIDLKQEGVMTIDKTILPVRRHMDTLTQSQTAELYREVYAEKKQSEI